MSGPPIPGYTYLQHLGSGGFADVYLYEQQWPQQRVAVKVVRPDVPLTEREKGLFTAEANAMAKLSDHPNIVSVITAGVTEDRPFLVMRYCPPPDLGVRVRSAPMSTADAIATGIKIASAVETAHRAGIVHRDIKPSNVLVTSYSEPALTDFGIAGHLHEVDRDTDVRISYPWSPPELLDGRSNGSVQSDVYSLGATIWNLLTGRSPFAVPHGDNSPQALTTRILHSAPTPTHRRDVPPGLERLLAQCLAKAPEHRPTSALELARELQRIEAEAGFARTQIAVEGDAVRTAYAPTGEDPDETQVKPITVIPASGPRAARIETDRSGPNPRPTPARATRGSLVWSAVGIVVALVVAAVVVLQVSGGDPADPTPVQTDPSFTPGPIEPGAPNTPPELTGTRDGRLVRFRWAAPDGGEPQDSWEVRRTDSGTGETQRGSKTTTTFRDAAQVCVQVRLIRNGTTSPVADLCK
ncbi:hypothetical protein GCM10027020_38170 [Nocardioides salsibiostraticola]